MPVIINRIASNISSNSIVPPILSNTPKEILPIIDHYRPPVLDPPLNPKLTRGRGYLNKPKKTLEQILPRVYNSRIAQPTTTQFTEKATVKHTVTSKRISYTSASKLDTDFDYQPYRCLDCKDTKKILVFDICEFCDGIGCPKCNKGYNKNYISCQSCNTKFKFL